MSLSDIIIHNNKLFYDEALNSNNFQVITYLHKRGYPQSLHKLTKKEKMEFSIDDFNKTEESFRLSTFHLLKDLVKNNEKIKMLEFCLPLVGNKLSKNNNEHRTIASQAISHGNIEAFKLLCAYFPEEKLNQPKYLLWYIHDARRSTKINKRDKLNLCKYIENLGLNWQDANKCLIRWANSHRNLEDLKYFYEKRKAGLNAEQALTLKRELINSIESFFKIAELESNLNDPVIDFIATREEMATKNNPYEGYFTIIKQAYKVAKKLELDTEPIENYFVKFLEEHKDAEAYLSKIKIGELQTTINKILLKERLDKQLNYSSVTNKINKI